MTEVKRYRKKPVEVDTMEWDGTAEGATPIINWILENGDRAARFVGTDENHHSRPIKETLQETMPAFIIIDTLEGAMRADVGDIIIRGVQNEFYPCKPDIFKKTYEEV